MIRLAFIACAVLVATSASAQTYKWKDAAGRWQYSDKPPANGQRAEKITQQNVGLVSGPPQTPLAGAAGATPAAGAKTVAEQEQDFRKRKLAEEETQKKLAKATETKQAKEDNCRNAKQTLAGLESGQRQVRSDLNGERRFLDDAEIQVEAGRMRQEVSKWCN